MSRLPNVRRRKQSRLGRALAAVAVVRVAAKSGTLVRLGLPALAAAGAFAVLKRRRAGGEEAPVAPPQSYRPTPDPAAPVAPSVNGAASGPDPAGPTATEKAKEGQTATPPHGDPLLDEAADAPPPAPDAGDDEAVGGPPNESAITSELAEKESEQG